MHGADGARSLYDFGTEAALLQPCALLHLDPASMAQPPLRATVEPWWTLGCQSRKAPGLGSGQTVPDQARWANATLRATGWTSEAHGPGPGTGGPPARLQVPKATAVGRLHVAKK